jgi:rod shape-determining protein MreB
MHGKTHENIKTIRPLRDGVIADFKAAEDMIKGMIRMIKPGRQLFTPNLRMVICIPSGITEVEKRAVKDSSEHAGAKEVYLIHEPMAAAIGIGIDVEEPMGNMIIDIGGGTSEIAVIALGGIVCDKNIRVAGDEFTSDIEEYMRRQHNILVGERTAEQIKIEVGAAMTELDNPPPDYAVRGRDLMTGIPKEITVTYSEIAQALDKSISKIEEAILSALEATPPELSADIYKTGIYLAGGGALLRGSGQAHQHQDQASGARERGPVARRGTRYRYRTEEHRSLPVPDAGVEERYVAPLLRIPGQVTPAPRCAISSASSTGSATHYSSWCSSHCPSRSCPVGMHTIGRRPSVPAMRQWPPSSNGARRSRTMPT